MVGLDLVVESWDTDIPNGALFVVVLECVLLGYLGVFNLGDGNKSAKSGKIIYGYEFD